MYQDNFLEELQAKYDTRKKDREVLIKEEEVKAKYSRFVSYITYILTDRLGGKEALRPTHIS